jgi:hypothetical protein
VLAANPKSVEEFRAGKEKAFNALVGQVMKATKGKANPGAGQRAGSFADLRSEVTPFLGKGNGSFLGAAE